MQREMIGGPNQTTFLRHHYASFFGGLLFHRPIGEYTEAELRDLCETFNVRWVYCWSDAARAKMRECDSLFRPAGTAGPYDVFDAAVEPGFVLDGRANIRAEVGRICVTAAQQPVTVLKYHWHRGLRTTPPLPVEPHDVPGAEMPFILVRNGAVQDFVIHQ
jgi:hypothetical protein